MTSKEFHLHRLADLHQFFRAILKRRWTNHLAHKLGFTSVNMLKPSYRKKAQMISLRTMEKLEAYAAELGFKPLSSENGPTQPLTGRCPECGSPFCLVISHARVRGIGNLPAVSQTGITEPPSTP